MRDETLRRGAKAISPRMNRPKRSRLPNLSRISAIALVSVLIAASGLLAVYISSTGLNNESTVNSTGSTTSVTNSAANATYVQLRAINEYGGWYPKDQNVQGVVNMVQSFREATGKPLSLLSVVQGPQNPSELVNGQGITVDESLLDLKDSAGGDIIPSLNLDYYTSGGNITNHSYCDSHNSTNCGPSWFWQVSKEQLSLTAVKSGGREVLLDAWGTFSRYQNASTIQSVLSGLKAEGWKYLITKQDPARLFPDYGLASYMEMTTQCQPTPPYCFENQNIINREWAADGSYLKGVFGMFDYQILNSGSGQLLRLFLSNFSAAQKAEALTNLASSQSSGRYTYVYPLIIGTVSNGTAFYWDAATELQANRTPFINLEEMLAGTY